MLKAHETHETDVAPVMAQVGVKARAAARPLALASAERKYAALIGMAEAVRLGAQDILDANAIDLANGEEAGLSPAMLDRLKLTKDRIRGIEDGIRTIAELKDPIGEVIAEWDRPNGLHIERVRTPLGVIGVIYESRPNVTADAGALCLKAGNAVILRGGSDSINSSAAIHACLVKGLKAAGLPEDAIQMVPTTDRAAVGEMLKGLGGNLDVIVPRGGRSLVERVQTEARVPVFAHLEGLCHLYIDKSAKLDMAVEIALNAKMRRTGICGAAETLLVDRAVKDTHLVPVLEALAKAGCEIRGTDEVQGLYGAAKPADDKDWASEYLDAIIAVKLVDGVGDAIEHIERWSSHHTEAVVADDAAVAERFFNEIDSAILLHNASTQFADGGEFGMGAEIGIATGRMHARGPVGVEQLTSFKYRVRGNGQVRS
ncbi:glutamate-5-semialdehyde dehydrogenase [Aerobium aerolatum]|uniref:Gamma-glutamyl phosphate reductase n=1 Tax=Aquamicrobium aerolatum DSM 21857 TaxID=1121003 RepID=A0A1I3J164_9HYPH|nr:glutamate-5-semialdehyde dehydrogenase [Aquamicrobium aerolatum]SFI53964.1 glutamate-5-semialdehyde dehydrogenase [Aquamicrobium aerolatum DSM 21857]